VGGEITLSNEYESELELDLDEHLFDLCQSTGRRRYLLTRRTSTKKTRQLRVAVGRTDSERFRRRASLLVIGQ
jgi:hypothetical protein